MELNKQIPEKQDRRTVNAMMKPSKYKLQEGSTLIYYLVGRGICGSDLGINKFGFRPTAGIILVLNML